MKKITIIKYILLAALSIAAIWSLDHMVRADRSFNKKDIGKCFISKTRNPYIRRHVRMVLNVGKAGNHYLEIVKYVGKPVGFPLFSKFKKTRRSQYNLIQCPDTTYIIAREFALLRIAGLMNIVKKSTKVICIGCNN